MKTRKDKTPWNAKTLDAWIEETFIRLRAEYADSSTHGRECFARRHVGSKSVKVRIVGEPGKARWQFSGGAYGLHELMVKTTDEKRFNAHLRGYIANASGVQAE